MSLYSAYTDITELPGDSLTQKQQQRLYQRYHLAGSLATDQTVLEIACGSGLGLSYVQNSAKQLIAGDYTEEVLQVAISPKTHSVPVVCFDAQKLPFVNSFFDFTFCFEAIYYLNEIESFLREAHRVLLPAGKLLIGLTNKEWSHFVPGSQSTQYYSIFELEKHLTTCGFTDIQFQGGFTEEAYSVEQRIIASLRHFIFSTPFGSILMNVREQLKPLIYRNIQPLKDYVWDGMTELQPLDILSENVDHTKYQVIFVSATKPND